MRWFSILLVGLMGWVQTSVSQTLRPPQLTGQSSSASSSSLPQPTSPVSLPVPTPTATPAALDISPLLLDSTTKTIYVFDLQEYLMQQPDNKTWQYDVMNLVTTLQGLVNRQRPQLYLLYVRERLTSYHRNVDQYWLGLLREPGGFLADYELQKVNTLEELLELFRLYYSSVVLWDPSLPATGNIALTIAGSDGMLPVRYDPSPTSLYSQIVTSGPELLPQVQLSGMFSGVGILPDHPTQNTTEVPKTDAYLWAKMTYLDSGLSAANYLANFLDPYDWEPQSPTYQYPDLDECSIVNHDFYISKKAFFMDLDPWGNEAATDTVDNPFHYGIDLVVFLEIMKSAYNHLPKDERILRVGGFVPWWIKYSSHYIYSGGRRGVNTPAETAEEFIGHISRYNGLIDADSTPFASMANASVFQHFPLPQRYYQNPVPPMRILENKNYLLFVIGDFRSSAQLYQTIPSLWNDSFRGQMKLSWALSPLMSERVPHIFDYLFRTRTRNDYFISGTPGAGLCYPNRFLEKNRPKGYENGIYFWQKFSQKLYQKFDLQISVAADLARDTRRVTTFSEPLQRSFIPFSPHGVGTLKQVETPLVDNLLPFVRESANYLIKMPTMDQVINRIVASSRATEPTFQIYRFNLANPTSLFYIYQRLQEEFPEFQFEAVDPYTFFYLKRQYESKGDPSVNFIIPRFLSYRIPSVMTINQEYPIEVILRNDGWDTWNPPDIQPNQRYRLTYRWLIDGVEDPGIGWNDAYVKNPVPPGDTTRLPLLIQSPSRPGLFQLKLLFGQENVRESYIHEIVRVVVNE